jgi:hypothetical protein
MPLAKNGSTLLRAQVRLPRARTEDVHRKHARVCFAIAVDLSEPA